MVSVAPAPPRARGAQEAVAAALAANAEIATQIVLKFRCNRIRTAPSFLYRYYQSKVRVK